MFVRFALRWVVFELRHNFWKSAPNDPKWPWHVKGQQYQYACYIHARGPNFHPFRSTTSPFQVMAQFLGKYTDWLKWPWHLQWQKYLYAHYTHSWILLYDKPLLSYTPCFGKVHRMTPNDLDMFMHAAYTPEAQISVLFTLQWAVSDPLPFFRKVHLLTPNDLDMFKVINTKMHATYTPEAHIFALRWAGFELFGKSALHDPKWPWQVQG